MLKVLLVGCGKMGKALAEGWKKSGICDRLVIVEPASSDIKSLKDVPADFIPQAVVFAVKPQTLDGMIGDYTRFSGSLFISIAAGKPVSFFEKHLGAKEKIVRCMPNLPASIGKGITVSFAGKHVTETEKEWATSLLSAIGDVLWTTDEKLMNPVTALSGSGPAYVFLLIEAMTKAGIHIGLDPAMAEKLARQTVIGSAFLAAESTGTPASTLRENVTSPGGTTQAALSVLMATPGIQDIFDRALAAASRRAEELST